MDKLKFKSVVLSFLFVLTVLTGCEARRETPPPDTVAQAVLDSVAFRDSLIKAEGEVAVNYYRLDDTVVEHAIYISGSGATAEEIAILKVSNSDSIDAAEEILRKRIEEQKLRYEAYVPEEMAKLEAPLFMTEGDLVISSYCLMTIPRLKLR